MALAQGSVQMMLHRFAMLVSPRTKLQQIFGNEDQRLTITAVSNTTPIIVTLSTPHHLNTGEVVFIKNSLTAINNSTANPYWTITVIGTNQFSLDGTVAGGAYTSGYVIPAMVCSIEGKHTPSRLLDFYNQARSTLAYSLTLLPGGSRNITGALSIDGTLKFTGKADGTFRADVPAGYLDALEFDGHTALLPDDYLDAVLAGYDDWAQSSDSRFIFRIGSEFVHYGNNVSQEDVRIRYLAIPDVSLSDVFNGAVLEVFDPQFLPRLLELAVAIESGQGSLEVLALAKKLVGA